MRIAMTNRALLHLLTWLSPAFPTGAFAYSHGLEWVVESGDVTNAGALRAWLRDVLHHGAGRNDAIIVRHAHQLAHDPAALEELAALATATAPGRERQAESLGQGNAFLLAARPWRGDLLAGLEQVPYPVALGALAGRTGIAEDDAALGFLQAFAGNLISAAVRLIPLGQSDGLAVLAALENDLLVVAEHTRGVALDALGGACFRADIAAIRHETQYTRLFRS
jgi:urease accessory protein